MILDNSPKLKIDNNKATLKDIKAKLQEEHQELIAEIDNNDLVKAAEELMDNIQVNILMLDYLKQNGIDIRQVSARHNKKLINRGWVAKAIIDIGVRHVKDLR